MSNDLKIVGHLRFKKIPIGYKCVTCGAICLNDSECKAHTEEINKLRPIGEVPK